MKLSMEVEFSFENLYGKHIKHFDVEEFISYDSNYPRDLDTQLYLGEFDWVKIIVDEKDPLGEWSNRIIFEYEGNYYSVGYREGSHGSGVNFYYDTLKQVKPKTKEVIYYE